MHHPNNYNMQSSASSTVRRMCADLSWWRASSALYLHLPAAQHSFQLPLLRSFNLRSCYNKITESHQHNITSPIPRSLSFCSAGRPAGHAASLNVTSSKQSTGLVHPVCLIADANPNAKCQRACQSVARTAHPPSTTSRQTSRSLPPPLHRLLAPSPNPIT